MPSPTLPDDKGDGAMIFEPHNLFGLNDPDGNPWPFGYVSEGIGRPIFELSVPLLKPDDPSLLPLALKMAAASELFEALLTFERQWNACGPNSDFGRYFQNVRDVAVAALSKADAGHWLNTSQAALAKAQGK